VAALKDVVPLPVGLAPERAVLSANMETALNAVWDASPGPGDQILIVGAGVVGCLVAFLCAGLKGANVTLVDINPERASVASALGVQFALPDNAPAECDVVFHCSASAAGLATAIGAAGEEAQVLELSWFGKREISLSLGGAFHSRQIRLQSSQVGHISATRRPRWTYRRRLQAAMGMLIDERLDVLLTHSVGFEDLPHQLPNLLGSKSQALCSLIRYP
jgi:threonine dehydrogenase-like Zn-dependent dehydrogenase